MYEDTPNKEEIDWIEERLTEIYDYEKLQECDIDYLHNLEYMVKSDMMLIKSGFPDKNGVQGAERAFLFDDERANKESLTQEEKIRLELIEQEVEREIRRAKGHRTELRRDHRSRIANAVADMIQGLGDIAPFRWIP
jgi:hypothetical protein